MARIEAKFQVVYRWVTFEFQPAGEGGYRVSVPAAPVCWATGETFEEALLSAYEVLTLRLRQDYASGMAIPEELLPVVDTFVEPGQVQFTEEEPDRELPEA